MMHLPLVSRRRLLLGGSALALAPLLAGPLLAQPDTSDLQTITGDAVPISIAERQGRIERARRLMREHGIDAVVIEAGASLVYFTGVEWWRSERLTAGILFAKGDAVIVAPFFEEPSERETLAIPAEVRVWQEDESPIALIAGALKERGSATGTIGSRRRCASSPATALPDWHRA